MITYKKGDLLSANVEALVNTVNTVGVMGKGIALQFKNQFPKNYKAYKEACKNNTFKVGEVLVVPDGDLLSQKLIINFPTKEHWKSDSKYEFIVDGLKALKKTIIQYGIKSIAIPPLGCGNGGLDWDKVRLLIEEELSDLKIDIQVFQPNDKIKSLLQSQELKKETQLTPARAMLMYLMYQYEALGDQSSLFVANKLAYFLQESGEKLRLKFEGHHYGPYSVQLNHVFSYLNGIYLRGMEQNEIKPFEPLFLNYDKYSEIEKYIEKELKQEQRQRLTNVINLIKGYQSTYALELLASVDFVKKSNSTITVQEIKHKIDTWNKRKADLFDLKHIEIAYKHLKNYGLSIT